MSATIWWDDSSNLADLIEYLVAKNGPMAIDDVCHVLRAPWKWDPQFRTMRGGEAQERRSA